MDFLQKVEKMPDNIRDFFTSDECRMESEKSFFLYGLDISKLEEITMEISAIFIGDENIENLPGIIFKKINSNNGVAYGLAYEISKRLFNKFPDYFKNSQALLRQWEKMKSDPIISEEESQKKLVEIEPWIVEIEKDKAKKIVDVNNKKIKNINISITQALQQYPKIGEQLITSSPVKLKIFPSPVRPSVKNWIEDYRSSMGAQKHGMMERGNYLFHSENGRMLTSGDRNKLAEVLRSLDEDKALNIDVDKQEIVFDVVESRFMNQESSRLNGMNHESRINNQKIENNIQDKNNNSRFTIQNSDKIRFSSAHTFPSEKREIPLKTQTNKSFTPKPAESFVPIAPKSEEVPAKPPQYQPPKPKSYSSYRANAGKSFEEVEKDEENRMKGEAKVFGNVVDLKN